VDSAKKSALANKAQANFVFRGIERVTTKNEVLNESKFWKVSEAVLDNIGTIKDQNIKYKIDIFDLKTGKDLLITYVLKEKKSKYGGLTSDMVQTPLSEDESESKAFIENDLKWYQVYTIKSYDYLSLIINGKTPWFDKPSNKWIDKATLNSLKPEEVPNNEEDEEEDVEDVVVTKKVSSESETDDLPF